MNEETAPRAQGSLARALQFWRGFGITRWINPTTDVTARLSFMIEDPIARADVEYVVEIAPGATVEIPSHLDHAIHRMHAGMVSGGLCPWLVRDGQRYGVHPSLIAPTRPEPIKPWFPKGVKS